MYCKNCGKEIPDNTKFCTYCGAKNMDAPGNGAATRSTSAQNSGSYSPYQPKPSAYYSATTANRKSKVAAGLLGIFLGGLGIHRFYLGYTGIGVIQIIVSLITFGVGALWGFIEGILILCGQCITTDSSGVPLGD